MGKEMEVKTTSVSAMSGIPWKKVRKIVNDSIAAGANIDISCDADGSWNIAIYPPEKVDRITVPGGDGINNIPYIQPVQPIYTDKTTPMPPFTVTCNTSESNG